MAKLYVKNGSLRWTDESALIFADISGRNGISRGAQYDLDTIRSLHSETFVVDIADAIAGADRILPIWKKPISNVYFLCQPDVYEHVLPLIEPTALRDAYRIGRWVWETPIFPSSWKFSELILHEVWAASSFCADVFRSKLSIPVKVMSHSVSKPISSDLDMRARIGIDQNAFLGLAVMDIRSCPERKNPWAHVLAWKNAFGNSRGAVLIIKIQTSKRTRIVFNELVELVGTSENVILVDQHYSVEELDALRRTCNVFISLHRSEGYGLNIHEALLCGKPTIATHWSANEEYGPKYPNYIGIGYSLIPYRDWTNHYEDSNFTWADANTNEVVSKLIALYREHQIRNHSP